MNNQKNHTLWVEKYRPQNLDSYLGNSHTVQKMRIFLESKDIPHLLFFGPAGTGKTSLAKILVNNIDCDYLYVNASDETSVENVRTKIKGFASTMGFKDLKIVILDESDFLSPNALAALRNLMETFSRTTRFILTCNYIERIIDPIISRCQTFNIVPPSRKEIAIHIVKILKEENIQFKNEDLAIIVNANYPDIRKCIQSCQQFSNQGKLEINKNDLIEQNYMLKIMDLLQKKYSKQKMFIEIRQILADSQVRKFEPLINFLHYNLQNFITDLEKQAAIILIIADIQKQLPLVVDQEITIMSMFIKIIDEL